MVDGERRDGGSEDCRRLRDRWREWLTSWEQTKTLLSSWSAALFWEAAGEYGRGKDTADWWGPLTALMCMGSLQWLNGWAIMDKAEVDREGKKRIFHYQMKMTWLEWASCHNFCSKVILIQVTRIRKPVNPLTLKKPKVFWLISNS